MNSDINEVHESPMEQGSQSQSADPKAKSEATTERIPVSPLLEYWANGFRVPAE